MGLDITTYSKMAPVARCDSKYPCENYEHVQPYVNPNFPNQADGIGGCYQKAEGAQEVDFRAGSYSGYNWWRNELCLMANGKPDAQFWENPIGPFSALIYFSDCEGVIGPQTSATLAADFARFQDAADAREDDDTMFTAKYRLWRQAFEIASDGGFVRFH